MQKRGKHPDGPVAESRAPHRRHVMLMIDPPIPARFEGIGRYAREHGWRLTLANRLVRAPRGWSGDGAIVTLRGDPAVVRFADGLARRGIPVVDVTCHRPDVAIPRVLPDYRGAGHVAALHFQNIGLKRAVWFSTEWSNVQALFCTGLEEGMAQLGGPRSVAADDPRTGGPRSVAADDPRTGGPRSVAADAPRTEPGPPAMRRIILSQLLPRSRLDDPDRFAAVLSPRLRALPKPVGLLAYNDEEAARVSALCLDIGIQVPEEIAILGIGNDAFLCENQAVPISSVIDNLERNGYEGAALLDRLMDGAPIPDTPVVVPCGGVCARRSTDTFAAESPVLREAVRLLSEHLDHPPGIDRIAQLTGVSRATLDRLFLRELGRPPHAELLRRRLTIARKLLRDTNLPAAEISAQCGFCNPAAFSAAFARAEGLPPGKWRKSATEVR